MEGERIYRSIEACQGHIRKEAQRFRLWCYGAYEEEPCGRLYRCAILPETSIPVNSEFLIGSASKPLIFRIGTR